MRWDSTSPLETSSHSSLTCFAPGNFLLGAAALNRKDIFEFGIDILEGCWHSYNVTPTGISPEGLKDKDYANLVWNWKSNDTDDQPHTQLSRKHWDDYGFWSTNRAYYLRPGPTQTSFNLNPTDYRNN